MSGRGMVVIKSVKGECVAKRESDRPSEGAVDSRRSFAKLKAMRRLQAIGGMVQRAHSIEQCGWSDKMRSTW
eukprot:6327441-Alexandrium_andersonii.AAC.1